MLVQGRWSVAWVEQPDELLRGSPAAATHVAAPPQESDEGKDPISGTAAVKENIHKDIMSAFG